MNQTKMLLQKPPGFIFKIVVFVLVVLNSITMFVGFHPHHDGLMLATIRLMKQNLIEGGVYPFNQYGSFWTLPYIAISMVFPDRYLLIAMRLVTFVLYGLSILFTYKLASRLFNSQVAKISVLMFLLARPIGLEPMPWPSSIGLFLICALTFCTLQVKDGTSAYKNGLLLLGCSIASVGLIFSRAQIGGISFLALTLYFFLHNRRTLLVFFGLFISTLVTYCLILLHFGWLYSSLKDEFVFGWIVASSDITDRSFPKTSLLILLAIALLLILAHLVNLRFSRINLTLLTVILLTVAIFEIIFPVRSTSLIGKFWVSVSIFGILVCLKEALYNLSHRKYDLVFLSSMGIASASQIYPLFDSMHAWWGMSPLSILLARYIFSFSQRFNVSNYLQKSLVVLLSVVFVAPFVSSLLRSEFVEINRNDLALTFLDKNYSERYQEETQFIVSNIKNDGAVLNLCADGRIFFSPDHPDSASRYFLYWPTMSNQNSITKEILDSNPEYVLICEDSAAYIPKRLIDKFSSGSFVKISNNVPGIPISIYGKSR